MKQNSPLRPAILTDEGDDFTYLVMPIRLPG
jgi:DNA polymerase III sliding clamp (beta) subunit (PCNA family)